MIDMAERCEDDVKEVVRRHIAGLKDDSCGTPFSVEEVSNGARLGTAAAPEDRFVVAATYAGRRLRWHVVYEAHDPTQPPDLLFPDSGDDGGGDLAASVELGRLTTLSPAVWRASDPAALRRVCTELVALVRARHRDAALALYPASMAAAKRDF